MDLFKLCPEMLQKLKEMKTRTLALMKQEEGSYENPTKMSGDKDTHPHQTRTETPKKNKHKEKNFGVDKPQAREKPKSKKKNKPQNEPAKMMSSNIDQTTTRKESLQEQSENQWQEQDRHDDNTRKKNNHPKKTDKRERNTKGTEIARLSRDKKQIPQCKTMVAFVVRECFGVGELSAVLFSLFMWFLRNSPEV